MKKRLGFLLAVFILASFLYINCVSATPDILGVITDNDLDHFYYDGQTATFNVSVVWYADTAGNLTVNCSALGDSGTKLAVNTTSLIGATNYTANCTINYSDIPISLKGGSQFAVIMGGNITFTAKNSSNSASSIASMTGAVIPYNMTTPTMTGDPCNRFGLKTTNMSLVDNFAAVNFVVEIQTNFSCMTNYILNGTNPGQYETVGLLNLTSLDMTSQTIGTRLAALQSAINVTIARAKTFASSRIFVNSTAFIELNSSGNVTLFNLPFTSKPGVLGDDGVPLGNVYWYTNGYNSAYGVNLGNLTFDVLHFSGYNATDNVVPIISIITPTASQYLNSSSPVINISVNGTGTEPSYILIKVNDSISLVYNSTSGLNSAGCQNISADREYFRCVNSTLILADGNYTVNVTAYDYGGGVAPGNYNSTFLNFTVDTVNPGLTVNTTTDDGNDNGGSTGGGDSYWITLYYPTDAQLKLGYTQSLGLKYRMSVKVGTGIHYVGVVGLTNTTATINVSSIPQQAVFNIGDVKKFDVTNDSYYDLSVKLNSIALSKANITVTSIHEQIPATAPAPVVTPTTSEVPSGGQQVTNVTGGIGGQILNLPVILWWVILVVIIIAIVVIILLVRKKKRKHSWDHLFKMY